MFHVKQFRHPNLPKTTPGNAPERFLPISGRTKPQKPHFLQKPEPDSFGSRGTGDMVSGPPPNGRLTILMFPIMFHVKQFRYPIFPQKRGSTPKAPHY